MMRLDDSENQAAAAAIIVEKISRRAGFTPIKFSFADEDLQPESSATEKMNSGLIRRFEDSVFVDEELEREFELVSYWQKVKLLIQCSSPDKSTDISCLTYSRQIIIKIL